MMTLSEWIENNAETNNRPANYKDIVDDVLAQLLGFICCRNDRNDLIPISSDSAADSLFHLLFLTSDESAPLRLNPDNIEIQKEESGFVKLRLSYNGTVNKYSEMLCDSGLLSCNEESDNVLAAGIIYAEMCFGEAFDYQAVVDLKSDSDLLMRMTATDPSKRISAREALEQLSMRKQSCVTLNFTEADSGAVIKTVEVPLNGSNTLLNPPKNFRNDDIDLNFYSNDTRTRKFYYRAAPSDETVFCSPRKKSEINKIEYSSPNKSACIGIDIGLRKINVSYIDNSGMVYDIFDSNPVGNNTSYPAAVGFGDDGEWRFGAEAIQFKKKTGAECLYIFERSLRDTIVLKSKNGQRGEKTSANLLTQFFFELKKSIFSRAGINNDFVSFVYTLPDEFDELKKDTIRKALSESGFGKTEITGAEAAACWITASETAGGNNTGAMMIVDAGEGATHIGVVKSKGKADFEVHCKKNAPGGDEMTKRLLEKAEYQIKFDIPRYMEIADNAQEVRACIESSKKALSFSGKSNKKVVLCSEIGEMKYINIMHYRKDLAKEIQEIEKSVQNCRDFCRQSKTKISAVVILGGMSLLPDLRECVKRCFNNARCDVKFLEYTEAVARGAAVYACFRPAKADKVTSKKSNVTTRDIGIQGKDGIRSHTIFKVMIPAGEKYDESNFVSFKYEYKVTDNELKKKECSLVLYTREAGRPDVVSTLDDEQNVIKPIGKFIITVPDKYKISECLDINIHVDRTQKVTAEIVWVHKSLFFVKSDPVDYKFVYAK